MKLIALGLFFIFLSFLSAVSCQGAEKTYIKTFCKKWKGEAEVTLIDNTRVDCLTKDYAVEVEFARKWKEPIAQSLHYALVTGKKAKIFLICESSDEDKYAERIKSLIMYYDLPIELETLGCSKQNN